MSSMPSVVMKEGTRRRVVTMPLTSPTTTPSAKRSAITHQVRSGSPSVSPAAATTTAVISAPTDRSNSPETMTNICPAARIISGAARLRKARKTGGSVKFGLRMAIQTSSPRRTTKIGAVPRAPRQARSRHETRQLLLEARPVGRGHARAPPAAQGVDRDRGDDDHPAQHVLEEGVDLELVEEIVEQRQDEHARDRPQHAALAAGERGAAEHDGRDRLQVVVAVGADPGGAGAAAG